MARTELGGNVDTDAWVSHDILHRPLLLVISYFVISPALRGSLRGPGTLAPFPLLLGWQFSHGLQWQEAVNSS